MDARFPGAAFHQLLLGSRTIAELEFAFPVEAMVKGESAIWPVA